MLFLIPHLFPSTRLLQAAAQDLRLPALQTLLARGTRQPGAAEGVEGALCEALGIARQQDWPLAPITLATDGGVAGDAYWLRADPVHLQVMRDRIVLADSSVIVLSSDEAAALAETIGRHFGADLSPQPLHPQRWYLRFPNAPRLVTTPLSVAVGRDIDRLLPQGADALQFRTWLNELQMLLHEHPVNLAREARGELPANSLWLWGGGREPVRREIPVAIYALTAEARALGAFCSAPVHATPPRLDVGMLAPGALVLLDALTHPGQYGDAVGWRDALRAMEQDWFAPLLSGLRKAGPPGLRLVDPVNGKALQLHAIDVWRLWRRRRSLVAALA